MKFVHQYLILFAIPVLTLNMKCLPDQIYKTCETCEKTCSEPYPKCPKSCIEGCFCRAGLVKGPDGRCVKLEECPKAETTFAQILSVEDCGSNEEYFSCGWCEATCTVPHPRCPAGACTRGCLCRPPLLRHQGGQCVEEKYCKPRNCTDTAEEYTCRYGCEQRCDGRKCYRRPRGCTLGCHCRSGFLRNMQGRCVTLNQC